MPSSDRQDLFPLYLVKRVVLLRDVLHARAIAVTGTILRTLLS